MSEPLLSIRNLTKIFGGLVAVDRNDAGALCGKQPSAGAANAAPGAGDDGALVAQAAVRRFGCLDRHGTRATLPAVRARDPGEERALPQTP